MLPVWRCQHLHQELFFKLTRLCSLLSFVTAWWQSMIGCLFNSFDASFAMLQVTKHSAKAKKADYPCCIPIVSFALTICNFICKNCVIQNDIESILKWELSLCTTCLDYMCIGLITCNKCIFAWFLNVEHLLYAKTIRIICIHLKWMKNKMYNC